MKLKLQLALVALVCAGAACWLAWTIVTAITTLQHDTAAGLRIVEFDAYDFVCIPLAAAAFIMAAMACFPQPFEPKRRRKKSAREKVGETMLAAFAICAFSSPLAVPIGRVIISDVVAGRGYHVCPVKEWRRPPIRWARTGIPCPA